MYNLCNCTGRFERNQHVMSHNTILHSFLAGSFLRAQNPTPPWPLGGNEPSQKEDALNMLYLNTLEHILLRMIIDIRDV